MNRASYSPRNVDAFLGKRNRAGRGGSCIGRCYRNGPATVFDLPVKDFNGNNDGIMAGPITFYVAWSKGRRAASKSWWGVVVTLQQPGCS